MKKDTKKEEIKKENVEKKSKEVKEEKIKSKKSEIKEKESISEEKVDKSILKDQTNNKKEKQENEIKEEENKEKKPLKLKEAIKFLRTQEKRNFNQTLDLIINLKKYDARKQPINSFVYIPHPIEKKIAAFLTRKFNFIDVITKEEFDLFKTPREIKKLAKKYDMFIAAAPLMTLIASKFGRALGPAGKMPSPNLGVVTKEDEETIKQVLEKMKKAVKVRTKERSIKVAVGKESMSDEELEENIKTAIASIIDLLPQKKENVKNVLIKFTMTKPVQVEYE
ncbi:MAG: hypothetical protein QW273_02175 [Candidatus Pacearchaeota archaeon]